MRKNSELHLRRIRNAKMIDCWFFEEGNSRRTHEWTYRLFILPLFGICRDSFTNYRLHYPDKRVRHFAPPPYIDISLWLPVHILKFIPICEANKFFEQLKLLIERALNKAMAEHPDKTLDAAILMQSIRRQITEEEIEKHLEQKEKEPVRA